MDGRLPGRREATGRQNPAYSPTRLPLCISTGQIMFSQVGQPVRGEIVPAYRPPCPARRRTGGAYWTPVGARCCGKPADGESGSPSSYGKRPGTDTAPNRMTDPWLRWIMCAAVQTVVRAPVPRPARACNGAAVGRSPPAAIAQISRRPCWSVVLVDCRQASGASASPEKGWSICLRSGAITVASRRRPCLHPAVCDGSPPCSPFIDNGRCIDPRWSSIRNTVES
jgi:hypothetical protein